MRDIFYQVRRGVKSGGFIVAVLITLYSFLFAHTDVSVLYTDPLWYFGSSTFYYFFIISFWEGLSRFALPLAGTLPYGFFLCEDVESGFQALSRYRSSTVRYICHRLLAAMLCAMLAVLLAAALYTAFLLVCSPLSGGESESYLQNRQGTSLGAIATPQLFWLLVITQIGRLMVSSAIWALVAAGFSSLWPNRAFVLIATFGFSLLLDGFVVNALGEEFALYFVQMPDYLNSVTPLGVYFARQLVYFGGAVVFAAVAMALRFSAPVRRFFQRLSLWRSEHIPPFGGIQPWLLPKAWRGTAIARLITDIRAWCTVQTLLPAAAIPLLVMATGNTPRPVRFSVGDLWLEVFKGIYWFDPVVSFAPIGRWLLLLLPPAMGIAMNLQRELGGRVLCSLNRFPSKVSWWLSKCIAACAYAFVCVCTMFFAVMVAGFLSGAEGFAVYWVDADGFMSPNIGILFTLFAVFFLQILMLTQVQVFFHLASGRLQLGVLAYVLPLLVCLIRFSIFDRPINVEIPYNWGMLVRTDQFSPSYMETDGPDVVQLCSIPVAQALMKQGLVFSVLLLLNSQIIRAIPISARQMKG